jgi:CheY-like chemotaxis protein
MSFPNEQVKYLIVKFLRLPQASMAPHMLTCVRARTMRMMNDGGCSYPMKLTALIVDDEDNVRQSLAKLLRRAGYETLLGANGDEADSLHQQHHPDIVLLDLNMPVRNGWDAFRAINTRDPLTPVIVVTGRPNQRELARAARVTALMEKPLDVPLLVETMDRLIREPASQRLSRHACGDPPTLVVAADDLQ